MRHVFTYFSPIGPLSLVEEEGFLVEINFEDAGTSEETPLLLEAARQLSQYFAKTRTSFSIPLNPKGTAFQRKVWGALQEIPWGETRTYGEIAAQIGSPKACRAVGMANHRNPLPIVIPCHRVIGANGKLVGYGGGLDIKEALLRLENIL